MGYLPLNRKDSITHMHGLAVYVKEGLPLAPGLSRENSADSYLFSTGSIHSVSYFFFIYRSPSSSLYTVLFYLCFYWFLSLFLLILFHLTSIDRGSPDQLIGKYVCFWRF